VPFAFVTGYSKDVLPPPYRDRPLLQKPFRTQAVLATLAMIIASVRPQRCLANTCRGALIGRRQPIGLRGVERRTSSPVPTARDAAIVQRAVIRIPSQECSIARMGITVKALVAQAEKQGS
jgi:hypothetical protein